jgi:D-sedoheptulose 7-phosphate isomerase
VGELAKGFNDPRPLPEPLTRAMADTLPEDRRGIPSRLQCGLPAFDLSAQGQLGTAIGNDIGFDLVFAQQLVAYGRKGDALFCISTSGNAENVVNAAAVARFLGMVTIGLTGRTGGRLGRLVDHCIRVPADDTAAVQELQLPVYHTLCEYIESVRPWLSFPLYGGSTEGIE